MGPLVLLSALAPIGRATAGAQSAAPPHSGMRPRLAGSGKSQFTVDGAGDEIYTAPHRPQAPILRWRLEKRDPKAAVSDVVQPIVVVLDPTMPQKWVPWVERGIKAWLPAFEASGFRNAIVVRTEPPAKGSVQGVSSKDRYLQYLNLFASLLARPADAGPPDVVVPDSMKDGMVHIFWWDDDSEGGGGIPIVDLSTGEIWSAAIQLGSTHFSVGMCQQYFTVMGDPQAQVPCPDSLVGRFLEATVSHEIGHTLGLAHNFGAERTYPTDSLRSPSFIHRWGHTPSVMSYDFMNYVAQPEDHVPQADLVQRIGPYDVWALGLAYRPIPEARTPEEELPTLERWRAAQDTAPYLRQGPDGDPGFQPAVIGDNLLKSMEYGMRNMARTVRRIRTQQDTTGLGRELRKGWGGAILHIESVVGGVVRTETDTIVGNVIRTRIDTVPIDSARQVQALRAVLAHTFRGKDEVVPVILGKTVAPDTSALVLFDTAAPGEDAKLWREAQERILKELVSEERFAHLAEQAPKTHVLPAVCAELRTLDRAFESAVTSAQSPTVRTHAAALREYLGPVLASGGQCHP